MNTSNDIILTDEQKNEIIKLKTYFPFRIVFGVIFPDGHFEVYAQHTKHKMNKFLKLGHYVVVVN